MKNEFKEYLLKNIIVINESNPRIVVFIDRPFPDVNKPSKIEVDNYINDNKLSYSFQKLLFRFIDDRKLKDSDVYNKVGIDRRLFFKIKNDINYHPSKETVILLALSLELTEYELHELLQSASLSLSPNKNKDLIITFCFHKQIYDIQAINELLYSYGHKILRDCK